MTATGARDKLITFERDNGTGKDDHGGKVELWQAYVTEWASVAFGNASERRVAAQQSATQAATFRVLDNSKTRALTPRDRIAGFLGSIWEITAVAAFDGSEVEITAIRKAA